MSDVSEKSSFRTDSKSVAELAELDAQGFLLAPGESASTFAARMKQMERAFAELKEELKSPDACVEVFPGIRIHSADRTTEAEPEIAAGPNELTERLFGFRVAHVPVFFLSRSVGLLWGGCSITDTESPLSIILLRNAFRKHKRFLIYRRDELVAHEHCHAARAPLHDLDAEEFFAYQTSPSRLRRYLGNCFVHQRDAVLFLLPILILLAASIAQAFFWGTLPLWPFWCLAAVYPAFLLGRNHRAVSAVRRAARKLSETGVEKPLALLFRSTAAERRELAAAPDAGAVRDLLANWAERELRWRVALYRFQLGKEA